MAPDRHAKGNLETQAQKKRMLSRRSVMFAGLSSGALLASPPVLRGLAEVVNEPQPYFASVRRSTATVFLVPLEPFHPDRSVFQRSLLFALIGKSKMTCP